MNFHSSFVRLLYKVLKELNIYKIVIIVVSGLFGSVDLFILILTKSVCYNFQTY